MVDERVRDAQRWVNATYTGQVGYEVIEENGNTGWSTVYALTRALQIELGVSPRSDSFGPATLSSLQTRYPNVGAAAPANIIKIIQAGLYCKGYNGGNLNGQFSAISASIQALKVDLGVGGLYTTPGVPPKLFKALLTMDAAVLLPTGSATARQAQQWMNGKYAGRANFFLMPTDGLYSRNTQKNLVYSIQYEIDMDDTTANGNFGPGTQSGLRSKGLLSQGMTDSNKSFVRLFQAAMAFNGYEAGFSGSFTSGTATLVRNFQTFSALTPVNGNADFQTWASLLVSTGDPSRRGTATDGITAINPAKAQTLFTNGYRVCGRYLQNASGGINKEIQPGELQAMFGAGLRVFPIWQTAGGNLNYFTPERGDTDAYAAVDAARRHGFRAGTVIYFAVDFDATDADITNAIIPYFRRVTAGVDLLGRGLRVGVYGARNVCSRLQSEGLTVYSFVSDMSTGFSGNLGYRLPSNWSFDQISTITVGSGASSIQIDNNISSGRDAGQSAVSPIDPGGLDVDFDMSQRADLLMYIKEYFRSIGTYESNPIYVNWTDEAVDSILNRDGIVTATSRMFRMRKALIQAPLIWELQKRTQLDITADVMVRNYWHNRQQEEYHFSLPPSEQALHTPYIIQPERDDSSTGYGQIFGRVAIRAINFANSLGLVSAPVRDPENWKDREAVWTRMNVDVDYSINTCALVLRHAADMRQIYEAPLSYTRGQHQTILARYNGTNDDATIYGQEVIGLFDVLESFNRPLRR